MSDAAVISVVGLTKVFKDFWHRARVRAVNDLDFEVHPGEIYGLLGPNGSGKSTTIKMLLGLLYPTRGRIAIFGKPPDDVRIKNRIGYLPEESYLYRFLNARETLEYYGNLFRINRTARRKRTEELLEMVGLRSAARRPVGEYSKGMQRRIGLAQALINDPDLLILDEPTSGLDPIGAKLVKDIIVRIGDVYKKTILLSSHLLADVEEVCNRVTILYGGQVQVTGTMDEVLARRDRTQIQSDRLSPETIEEVRRVISEREGKTAEVITPHDRLESLFLRIMEQAHERKVETAGTDRAGEIAGFLGQSGAAEQVLEELVHKPAEPAPVTPEPVKPQSEAVDSGVLSDLTEPQAEPDEQAPGAEAPPEPPPADVDESVLGELTGERRKKE